MDTHTGNGPPPTSGGIAARIASCIPGGHNPAGLSEAPPSPFTPGPPAGAAAAYADVGEVAAPLTAATDGSGAAASASPPLPPSAAAALCARGLPLLTPPSAGRFDVLAAQAAVAAAVQLRRAQSSGDGRARWPQPQPQPQPQPPQPPSGFQLAAIPSLSQARTQGAQPAVGRSESCRWRTQPGGEEAQLSPPVQVTWGGAVPFLEPPEFEPVLPGVRPMQPPQPSPQSRQPPQGQPFESTECPAGFEFDCGQVGCPDGTDAAGISFAAAAAAVTSSATPQAGLLTAHAPDHDAAVATRPALPLYCLVARSSGGDGGGVGDFSSRALPTLDGFAAAVRANWSALSAVDSEYSPRPTGHGDADGDGNRADETSVPLDLYSALPSARQRGAAESAHLTSFDTGVRSGGASGAGGAAGGRLSPPVSAAACSQAVNRYGSLLMSSAGWRCTEMFDIQDVMLLSRLEAAAQYDNANAAAMSATSALIGSTTAAAALGTVTTEATEPRRLAAPSRGGFLDGPSRRGIELGSGRLQSSPGMSPAAQGGLYGSSGGGLLQPPSLRGKAARKLSTVFDECAHEEGVQGCKQGRAAASGRRAASVGTQWARYRSSSARCLETSQATAAVSSPFGAAARGTSVGLLPAGDASGGMGRQCSVFGMESLPDAGAGYGGGGGGAGGGSAGTALAAASSGLLVGASSWGTALESKLSRPSGAGGWAALAASGGAGGGGSRIGGDWSATLEELRERVTPRPSIAGGTGGTGGSGGAPRADAAASAYTSPPPSVRSARAPSRLGMLAAQAEVQPAVAVAAAADADADADADAADAAAAPGVGEGRPASDCRAGIGRYGPEAALEKSSRPAAAAAASAASASAAAASTATAPGVCFGSGSATGIGRGGRLLELLGLSPKSPSAAAAATAALGKAVGRAKSMVASRSAADRFAADAAGRHGAAAAVGAGGARLALWRPSSGGAAAAAAVTAMAASPDASPRARHPPVASYAAWAGTAGESQQAAVSKDGEETKLRIAAAAATAGGGGAAFGDSGADVHAPPRSKARLRGFLCALLPAKEWRKRASARDADGSSDVSSHRGPALGSFSTASEAEPGLRDGGRDASVVRVAEARARSAAAVQGCNSPRMWRGARWGSVSSSLSALATARPRATGSDHN
ncbi:hypothetical protein GPECTOR_26g619 [Gonium pectorale]|uniref:Uncharacterized protein n=1 Tax=Gonium pectorale TaxID=33097 RepID=A0A150GFV9_GONPE|nr:hypothetical protein GPECTOR_26g619 [Gonium pectorale]|eukprot:KXZ48716.1 hypothetical protein GPECTOR_26g619 [Gonium pectorale]